MHNIQKQYLFFFALLACLLCLFSLPVSVCSQNLQSVTPPPSSDNTSDGTFQKNEIDGFFAKFNGCAWYKIPYDPSVDMYLELKDRNLILYEYIKDQFYCLITSRICFAQVELWRMKVTGYEIRLSNGYGNAYRVVINRNGETITLHGIDKITGREYLIDTFVKYFCSGNI